MTCKINIAGHVFIGYNRNGRVARSIPSDLDRTHTRLILEEVHGGLVMDLAVSLEYGRTGYLKLAENGYVYVAALERTTDDFNRPAVFVHAMVLEQEALERCGTCPFPWSGEVRGRFVRAEGFGRLEAASVGLEGIPASLGGALEYPGRADTWDEGVVSALVRRGFNLAVTPAPNSAATLILERVLKGLPASVELDLAYITDFVPKTSRKFRLVAADALTNRGQHSFRETLASRDVEREFAERSGREPVATIGDARERLDMVKTLRALGVGSGAEVLISLNGKLQGVDSLNLPFARVAGEFFHSIPNREATKSLLSTHLDALLKHCGEYQSVLLEALWPEPSSGQAISDDDRRWLQTGVALLGASKLSSPGLAATLRRRAGRVEQSVRPVEERSAVSRPVARLLRLTDLTGSDATTALAALAAMDDAGLVDEARRLFADPDAEGYVPDLSRFLWLIRKIHEGNKTLGERLLKALWRVFAEEMRGVTGRAKIAKLANKLLYPSARTGEWSVLANLSQAAYHIGGDRFLHDRIMSALTESVERYGR